MMDAAEASIAQLVGELVTSETLLPECEQDLAGFAPLLGSWRLDVTDFGADGTRIEREGEWHFSWGLGGRALIDVWITPSRATRKAGEPGEWGMSVRFPSVEPGTLLSTWLGPERRIVFPFKAAISGDVIVLSGNLNDDYETRWTFTNITEESFSWRNEEFPRDGSPARLLQTFEARRAL